MIQKRLGRLNRQIITNRKFPRGSTYLDESHSRERRFTKRYNIVSEQRFTFVICNTIIIDDDVIESKTNA